jgi:hypothetical protein
MGMKLLTNHAIQRITEALDEGYFTVAGFHLKFPEEGDLYCDVRFRDNNEFYFTVQKRYQSAFSVEYSPGSFTRTQTFNTDDFDDCCRGLVRWSECIRRDIIASNPVYFEFEEFKKDLNEQIEERFKNSMERFTESDLTELKEKFDDLGARLNELHQKNELNEQQLKSIKETLNALVCDANRIPKKTWYRAAANRITNLMCKVVASQGGQRLLEESARKLLNLPGGPEAS